MSAAVVREVREETGLDVTCGPLLFANDTIDPHGVRHGINLTFAATVIGGNITGEPQDDRVEAVEIVEVDSLDDTERGEGGFGSSGV